MDNDYIIIENALPNPEDFVNLAGSIAYVSRDVDLDKAPDDIMIIPGRSVVGEDPCEVGMRSLQLYKEDAKLYEQVSSLIKQAINRNDVVVDAVMHIIPDCVSSVRKDRSTWWHRDSALYAGVIYLTEDIPKDTGTLLRLESGEEILIENVFNRMVIYSPFLRHTPAREYGNTFDTARKALTFFVRAEGKSIEDYTDELNQYVAHRIEESRKK